MVSNDSGLCMGTMVLSLSTQGMTILSVRMEATTILSVRMEATTGSLVLECQERRSLELERRTTILS